MTNANFGNTQFALDVRHDLERVDESMTRLLRDRDAWSDFIRDPNGMLIKLGLHPHASSEANERTNKVFYAVLSNREVIRLAIEMLQDFEASNEAMEHYNEGLRKGVIQNLIEHDLQIVNHVFSQTERIKQLYQLALHDVNDKGILTRRYSQDELNQHIDLMVEGVQSGLPIRDLPTLETWDRYYGVGTGYGFGEAEVGPAVSAVVVAEIIAAGTIAIPVAVFGAAAPVTNQLVLNSLSGDKESTRALDILTRMHDFASDLMIHVQSFENYR